MLRWTKWVAPMAALVLMAGLQSSQTRAEDSAAKPNGKATVTVTVVDAADKPVVGATVGIAPAPVKGEKGAVPQPDAPKGKPTPIETGTTGADGTFALTNIPNGNFVVMARLKGSGNGHATVTVADDKDQAVTVTLKSRKAGAN